MKYKDNNFLNYQDKQRSGEFDYNSNKSSSIRVDRQIRREQEHRLSLFYRKKLSNKIEKIWWNNLKTTDKEEIRRSYNNQLDYLSHSIEIRDALWYTYKVFDIWEEWFDYIKVEFKPNKVTYRQDKLKILGI
jgi:hypothetical protein